MAKKVSMVRRSAIPVALVPAPVVPLRLDFGCGTKKREGFIGVDVRKFAGVDKVLDLTAREPSADSVAAFDVLTKKLGPEAVQALKTIVKFPTKLKPWPWANDSVDEIYTSHFVEHLDPEERIHFVNESFRIMKPGAKLEIHVPPWSSCRAYGDLTHKWAPVSEFWFYYLNAQWRATEAPHNDFYTCNFDIQGSFGMRPELLAKNKEQQEFAIANYKDACIELIATFIKPTLPTSP